MQGKIMISKDTSLIRDGVWVNGIKITTSEDWNKVVEESIPKQKIRDKIEELEKEQRQLLKGTKGQDRYNIKQEYMYKINVLKELLEE